MGLFSFLHKNKQDAAPGKSDYRSQSDEPFTNARTRTTRPTRGNTGKDAGPDPILPEKKRARRRLIGAVVLVLAVVIVLPMILDPEPKPLADDISVQIPSRGDNGSSDSKVAPAATAPATAAPATPVASTTPATPVAVASTAPIAAKQPDSAALDPKEELVDTKPVEKPVQAAAAPVQKAPEKVLDKPVEKPAEKSSKAEKAEKAEKATAAAEAKHAAAAPAAAKVTDEQRALAILQGKPVPSASAATSKADASAGKFVIQVAALATQEKIDELRAKLTSAGLTSYTQKVATQAGDRTRIRVGPFATRDEADKARAKIIKLGLNATLVPT